MGSRVSLHCVIFGFRFSYNINVKAPDEETTNVSKACDKQYIFAAENFNNSAAYHLCGQQICGKSVETYHKLAVSTYSIVGQNLLDFKSIKETKI